MTCSRYVKSRGIRSVRALAEFIEVRPETVNRWFNDNREVLDGAIKRYLEAKK